MVILHIYLKKKFENIYINVVNITYYYKMNKIHNLELADKDAWKKSFKDSYNYNNLGITNVIFEILGSVKQNNDVPLKIEILSTKDNIIINHNGLPLDQSDIERLLKIATHKNNENKKGVSKQGIGWRAIADGASLNEFSGDGEINEDEILKYSLLISKHCDDICIDDENLPKNDIIAFIHDNKYQIMWTNDDKFDNLYNKYVDNEYGVLFIIPNRFKEQDYNDYQIIHDLKLLYNRKDCQLIYKNENTEFTKNIFENKPFYYIDKNIDGNKYLEVECRIYTYSRKKVIKMKIIHQKQIIGLSDIDHYYWMDTSKNETELISKYNDDEWEIYDIDESQLKYENISFILRMMGFNPDNHKTEGSTDFKKWWAFYTNQGSNNGSGNSLQGYGDGIVPYIDENCLTHQPHESKRGYTNHKTFNPTHHLQKIGAVKRSSWVREIKNGKKITYKEGQNLLCELIETRENVNNNNTLLTINPIKSKTTLFSSDNYQRIIPFWIVWLNHKFLWETNDGEETNELTDAEKLIAETKEKEKAQKAAEKAEKQKLKAQKKAEEAEKQKRLAQKKADEEEKQKLLAQQKASKSQDTNDELLKLATKINEQKNELENDINEKYIPIEDEINVNEGHCYCLFDPTREGYRKIGKSSKDQDKLEKQYISRYMPEGIKVIHWVSFDNSKLAEKHIFEKLKNYRIKNTEWFKFPDMEESSIDDLIEDKFSSYKSFMEQ